MFFAVPVSGANEFVLAPVLELARCLRDLAIVYSVLPATNRIDWYTALSGPGRSVYGRLCFVGIGRGRYAGEY